MCVIFSAATCHGEAVGVAREHPGAREEICFVAPGFLLPGYAYGFAMTSYSADSETHLVF